MTDGSVENANKETVDGTTTETTADASTETTGNTSANFDPDEQRAAVRDRYAGVADDGDCCGPQSTATSVSFGTDESADDTTNSASNDATADASCCGSSVDTAAAEAARAVGYADDDLDAVPVGANLGLACGNPQAIADLDGGEDVLDLGAGGGFDCFLAARAVGPAGRVVGVDMTPEMVDTARENAANSDLVNVEFRLGEIEHLPVADASVDVVVSNCVVNLSPDKAQVFREAYRVLRPGGRVAVSDLVAVDDIPREVREDADAVAACVGGAVAPDTIEELLADAGFEAVSVTLDDQPGDRDEQRFAGYVASATIEAHKPDTETRERES